jgi:c(7)-type cytochrome triheme protein
MMLRANRLIILTSLILVLVSCKWKTEQQVMVKAPESPIIESLRDSSLPCFDCHGYENFALNERGKFSHDKHVGFEIHCNHCHIIKAHMESTINTDVCNRCHKVTNFSFDAAGMPVDFSHQQHAGKFNCSKCHPETFNMKKGTTHITMDEMYKGNSCGKCHNGQIAFASTECAKCHQMSAFNKELSYRSGGVSPAVFSHSFHTSAFECSTCHTSVFKYKKHGSGMKMDDIYKGKYCGTCHNEQMAFGPKACNKCHK